MIVSQRPGNSDSNTPGSEEGGLGIKRNDGGKRRVIRSLGILVNNWEALS